MASLSSLSSGVSAASARLSGLSTALFGKSGAPPLRQASFRGIPFAVFEAELRVGRRTVQHDYPFRDKIFVEDLGRKGRVIQVTGFLVTNSAIYGGGDVTAQRDQLVFAAETEGPGTLIHPTLGELTVSCPELSVRERWDAGRAMELSFSFLEAGDKEFPLVVVSARKLGLLGAITAKLNAALAFVGQAVALLKQGAAILKQAIATVNGWVGQIQALAADAAGLLNQASQLVGSFGRFFNGSNAGGFPSTAAAPNAAAQSLTVPGLIAQGAAARATVAAKAAALGAVITGLNATTTAADVGPAVADLVDALVGACANPADAIRLLEQLIAFVPAGPDAASPIGQALGDLFRRDACAALAAASAAYQPASYDDAAALRDRLTARFEAEITLAGDQGADDMFDSLRALRTAVADDLRTRGASLAPIRTFTTGRPMPALALAQRLYRDPARADELVTQADPVHPLFMPVSFRALAS